MGGTFSCPPGRSWTVTCDVAGMFLGLVADAVGVVTDGVAQRSVLLIQRQRGDVGHLLRVFVCPPHAVSLFSSASTRSSSVGPNRLGR